MFDTTAIDIRIITLLLIPDGKWPHSTSTSPIFVDCSLYFQVQKLRKYWSIEWRLSYLVVFNLTCFDILVLVKSQWKFHHLSSRMITIHDLASNCWTMNNLLMSCRADNWILSESVEILNHSSIWHQIMFTDYFWKRMLKFLFWCEQYQNIEKGKIENDQVWKSWWKWSTQMDNVYFFIIIYQQPKLSLKCKISRFCQCFMTS